MDRSKNIQVYCNANTAITEVEVTKLENIIKGMRRYYPVSDSSINMLTQQMKETYLPKYSLLTQGGLKNNYVYFLEQGCAHTYFLYGSNEVTNWFSKEGEITFSSSALYHRSPALEYVQLLEDSLLYLMPINALNELYETNTEIANWSRVIHQEALLKMQNLRLDRLSLTTGNGTWTSQRSGGDATIIITSIDPATNTISGTFTAKLVSTSKLPDQIINHGSFTTTYK